MCGITRLEDALCAIEHGVDALGFILYEKSKRYINPKDIRAITSKLPPFVERVGVFVEDGDIDGICQKAGLGMAQIHSNMIDTSKISTKTLQVVRAKSREDIVAIDSWALVDAHVSGYGGKGARVPLEWFDGVDCSQLVLAGGLDALALPLLAPYGFYGVDVSSGVEESPGIKSRIKMREFLEVAETI